MQMEELKDNENLPRRSRWTVMVDAMTTELQIGSSDAASCKTLANIFELKSESNQIYCLYQLIWINHIKSW